MPNEHRRHILVTGGSRGLGAALAGPFLACGDLVTTCSRSDAPTAPGGAHSHIAANVGAAADVQRVFAHIRERVGYLDVLINNAGLAAMNSAALTPPDSIRELLEVNVQGTMLMSQAALRLLRGSPCGRIVNMTSVAVPLRLHGESVYAASKAAVE